MADDAVIMRNSDKANQGEADASVAVTPGELLERAAGGDYGPHGTAAGAHGYEVAGVGVDPELEKTDDVPADARFYLWRIPPGSGVEVDMIASAAIAENDYVVSDGAGRVRTMAAGEEDARVGQAVEAAAAAGGRVTVRF